MLTLIRITALFIQGGTSSQPQPQHQPFALLFCSVAVRRCCYSRTFQWQMANHLAVLLDSCSTVIMFFFGVRDFSPSQEYKGHMIRDYNIRKVITWFDIYHMSTSLERCCSLWWAIWIGLLLIFRWFLSIFSNLIQVRIELIMWISDQLNFPTNRVDFVIDWVKRHINQVNFLHCGWSGQTR